MSEVAESIDIEQSIKDLQKTVNSISAAMEKISKTGIGREALIRIICHASPNRVQIGAVSDVLDGIENVSSYLFPHNIQDQF